MMAATGETTANTSFVHHISANSESRDRGHLPALSPLDVAVVDRSPGQTLRFRRVSIFEPNPVY